MKNKFTFILFSLISFNLYAHFSVSTFNIRNFDKDSRSSVDKTELKKIIINLNSDVIAFEEVVNAKAFEELIKDALPEYQYKISKCGGTGRQKLALVFHSKKFQFISENEDLSFSDFNGNKCGSLRPVYFVKLKDQVSKESYTFGLVHLKAGGSRQAMQRRWEQYKNLEEKLTVMRDDRVIVLGDFNTTGYLSQDDDFLNFSELLSRADFFAATSQLGCSSYWDGGSGGTSYYPSLLDHVLLTSKFPLKVNDVSVGTHCQKISCQISTAEELGKSYASVSDHCPIKVTFKK